MKVEQLDIIGNKVLDCDQKIVNISECCELINSCGVKTVIVSKKPRILKIINSNGKEFIVFPIAITYLGNSHRIFKKRVQFNKNMKKNLKCFEKDAIFLGIYKYNDNYIFVDFDMTTYIMKKMNNSSAHVHTNDLYQAMVRDLFFKIDRRGNKMVVIRKSHFKNYIDKRGSKVYVRGCELFSIFDSINAKIPFNKRLAGESCYAEMIESDYKNALQAEWPGFYLEHMFSRILINNNISPELICFTSEINTVKDKLNFDLFSMKYNFYSDLKASDKNQTATILNDQNNIRLALERHYKLWYVIYEHKTIKDSERDNVVSSFWNTKLKELKGKDKKLDSYADRMKGEVYFENMMIIEINKINAEEILKDFNQGKNSNGKERKLKFKINKAAIDNYVIFRYENNEK